MKNFKRILALLTVVAIVFAFAACSNPFANNNSTTSTTLPEETTVDSYSGPTIKVAAIKGPTGMGMVNLMNSNAYSSSPTSAALSPMWSPWPMSWDMPTIISASGSICR